MILKKYLKSEIILIKNWKILRKKKLCSCKKQADLNSDNKKKNMLVDNKILFVSKWDNEMICQN